MSKTFGYMIFVSYNRNEYEMKGISLDDMTINEFVEFCRTDEVNCMSVEIDAITSDTKMLVKGTCPYDDSVCWYLSEEMVEECGVKEFVSK